MRKPKYIEKKINNKTYYLHHIEWMDILGDSGHGTTAETLEMKPAIKDTYAFVLHQDDDVLISASTNDKKEDEWSDRNVFPIGCIIKKTKIEIR